MAGKGTSGEITTREIAASGRVVCRTAVPEGVAAQSLSPAEMRCARMASIAGAELAAAEMAPTVRAA